MCQITRILSESGGRRLCITRHPFSPVQTDPDVSEGHALMQMTYELQASPNSLYGQPVGAQLIPQVTMYTSRQCDL